jgi:hypothetical protein
MKIYLCLFILLSAGACQKNPATLMGNLKSYSSMEEMELALGLGLKGIDTIENSKLNDGDIRPPYSIFTIEFDYSDLEVNGRLQLSFFNNRLVYCGFIPADWKIYLRNLKDERGIDLSEQEKFTKRGVKIWKGTDFKNRKYIGWEDNALDKENQSWIRQHS